MQEKIEETFSEEEIIDINKAKEAGKNFPYPNKWYSLSVLERRYYFEYQQWVILGKKGEAPTLEVEKDNLSSIVFAESSNAVKSELAALIPEATELEIAAVRRPENQQLPVSKIPRFQRSITQLSSDSSSSGISSASPTNSQDKNLELRIEKNLTKPNPAVGPKIDCWNNNSLIFSRKVTRRQLGDDPNLDVGHIVDCHNENYGKNRKDIDFIRKNKLNVSKKPIKDDLVSASLPNSPIPNRKLR